MSIVGLLLLPLIFLFSNSVQATWTYGYAGQLSLIQERFIEGVETDTIKQDNQIYTLEGSFSAKSTNGLTFRLAPYARFKPTSVDSIEQNYFDLQEALVESHWRSVIVKAGTNIFNWGIIDFFSPLDVVNQKAYFDPLSPIKIGVPNLDVSWSGSTWSLQALYIPKRRSSVFPASDSRWLPREIILNSFDGGDVILPDEFFYNYGSGIEFQNAFSNNYAFKASTSISDFDLQFVYYKGLNANPHLEPHATFNAGTLDPDGHFSVIATSDVTLVPVAYLTQVVGMSLVWAPELFIMRFESAYTTTELQRSGVTSWSAQNALSFEKQFYIGENSFTALVHYYKASVPKDTDNLPSSSFRIFDDTIVASILWAPTDSSSIGGGFLYDQLGKSEMGFLGADFKIAELLRMDFKYVGINGPDQTLLGTYKNNDFAKLGLKLFF